MGWGNQWIVVLGVLLLQAPMGWAQSMEQVPSFPVEIYRLPSNGLTVVLSEDHSLPLVSVHLWYKAGPRNETQGRSGFAHLFEHLMFEGSKHVPQDAHLKWLESRGGTDLNASTSFDHTRYHVTVPARELPFVLWLESDRMAFLLDTMNQDKLDGQRKVVQNERRQMYENAPYGPSREAVGRLLYPPEHPYAANIIGSMADLEAATLEDVAHFYTSYYAPANAVLTLVGDFSTPQAKAWIERYFATLPSRAAPKPSVEPHHQQPNISQERRLVVSEPVHLPQVTLAWHTPALFASGDAEADILAHLLGQGPSSRLYRRLVLEEKIADKVTAYQMSMTLGSQFLIIVQGHRGVPLARLEGAVDEVLQQLQQNPPTEQEIERAKKFIRQNLLESLQDINHRASMLSNYQILLDDADKLTWDMARYRQVTPTSVMALVRTWLAAEKRVVIQTMPEHGGDHPR